MALYASYIEFKESAHQAKDTDASIFRTFLERASRAFDLLCGVEPDYFASVTHALWQSNRKYEVGDVVVPTTSNVHKYRVTTAGTSGATEPTWPTGSGATVTNGTAVFTENGTDVIAATEKVIYGSGTNFLRLPPYIAGSITEIEVPSGHTAPDYAEVDGYLVVTSSTGEISSPGYVPDGWGGWNYGSGWWNGLPITITAKWGYNGVPADIKRVVIEMAILEWRTADPAMSRTSDLDALKNELSPLSLKVVQKYSMKKAVVFV